MGHKQTEVRRSLTNNMKHTEASRVVRRINRVLAWLGPAACVALGNSTATG